MSFGELVQLGWLGLDINSFEMEISRSNNRLFRYVMGVVSRGFEIVWCFDALKPNNENVFASKWSHSLLVRAVPCCLIADKSVAWTSWLAVGDLQSKFTASFKKMNLIENGYIIQLSWCWLLQPVVAYNVFKHMFLKQQNIRYFSEHGECESDSSKWAYWLFGGLLPEMRFLALKIVSLLTPFEQLFTNT